MRSAEIFFFSSATSCHIQEAKLFCVRICSATEKILKDRKLVLFYGAWQSSETTRVWPEYNCVYLKSTLTASNRAQGDAKCTSNAGETGARDLSKTNNGFLGSGLDSKGAHEVYGACQEAI